MFASLIIEVLQPPELYPTAHLQEIPAIPTDQIQGAADQHDEKANLHHGISGLAAFVVFADGLWG